MIDVARDAAREAGKIVAKLFRRDCRRIRLKNDGEPVTNADLMAEAAIVEVIEREYPTHGIIAEESGARRADAEHVWYVDPLDGTCNFAAGIPFFCVSIGVARGGRPILGVAYAPLDDELFSAEQGQGCFLNGKRVRVSSVAKVSEAIIEISDMSGPCMGDMRREELFRWASRTAGRRRILGSTVLGLAYVAAARLDARIKIGSQPWDQVAGQVLVEEAGGTLTDFGGRKCGIGASDFVASNRTLHAELLSLTAGLVR